MTLTLTLDCDHCPDILELEWPDGGTATRLGLDWARNELTTRRRQDVPRVIVLLVDGISDIPSRALQIARAAQQSGIQMFAVGTSLYSETSLYCAPLYGKTPLCGG